MTKTKSEDRMSSLPEEIIEMIAKQCGEHVLSLRRTCRNLEHKTWRTFSTTYFGTRRIWVSPDSLGLINQMAKNERVAGCVKKLIVQMFVWQQEAEHAIRHGTDHPSDPPDKIQFGHDQFNEQQFFLHSGQFSTLLSSTMALLPDLEQVGLSDWAPPADLWPFSHLKVPDSHSSSWRIDYSRDTVFDTSVWFATLLSISQTRPSLKCLGPCSLSYVAVAHVAPSIMRSLSRIFSSLQTLDISIEMPYIEGRYRIWRKAFASFLHTCPNIDTFHLDFAMEDSHTGYNDFDPYGNDPILNGLAQWPTFRNLNTLELTCIEVLPVELVEFLGRHKGTLKNVEIVQAWFGLKRNAWREVLTCLKGFDLIRLQFLVNDLAYDYDLVDAMGNQIMVEIDRALKEGLRKPILGPHEEDEWVSQESSEDEGDDEGEEADYVGNVHFDEW